MIDRVKKISTSADILYETHFLKGNARTALRVDKRREAFIRLMHINFQNEIKSDVTERTDNHKTIRTMDAYGGNKPGKVSPSGIVMDIGGDHGAAYGFKGVNKGEKKDKAGILDDAASFDAKNAHNYMAVMSNTMSLKDFQEMKEEGYHPGKMSEAEAVTNLDRIKVILSEAGVDVAGFTDTVDRKTAAKITGSEVTANRITDDTPVNKDLLKDERSLNEYISKNLKEADLPATEDNISSALKAFDTASKIEAMDKGDMEYMVLKGEEPTIDNVYMAEHSGGKEAGGQGKGYFRTEGAGYFAEAASSEDLDAISGQIENVIREAGFDVTDETREDARELIRGGFALTKENLSLYEDLKGISFPLKAGDLMQEIAEAEARGERAGNAYLIRGYNRIKNERIFNETRLVMNSEANRSISSDNGFMLDTEELSEKVELLKEKERAFYHAAFAGNSDKTGFSLEDSISLAEETAARISEIRNMPAAVAGSFVSAEAFTVNDIYEAGNELKAKFDAANATYEAVGTEVRADLGDRIGDAFKNIGSLLKDIAFEETADNLRAVRILGYNGMEVTAENVMKVKSADQTIRTLVDRLTGSAVVSLIRDGVNPLETNAQDLIDRITKTAHTDEDNAKFSEYLFRLERNNEISEDEAESYIGIYRLLRQIEKSDGAVIGALVNNGRELSLKNLLSELRTRSRGSMDFKIDDEFGGILSGEGSADNMRIDTQIGTAFRKEPREEDRSQHGSEEKQAEARYSENALHEVYDNLSPEGLRDLGSINGDTTLYDILNSLRNAGTEEASDAEILYNEEELEVIKEAAAKDEAVYEMLLGYGQNVTAENVVAMDALMNNRGAIFEALLNSVKKDMAGKLRDHSERILDSMESDTEDDPSEAVKDSYGEMSDDIGEALKDAAESAETYIDLKTLQNINRQFSVAKALSNEENYEVPMEIEGRMTSVNVKIVRGTGESRAAVSFETVAYGKVYAEFTLNDGNLSGIVTSSTDEGTELLRSAAGALFENENVIFEKSLNSDINRIPKPADIKNRSFNNTVNTAGSGTDVADNENTSEGMDAGKNTAILYRRVSEFIRSVK